MFGLNDSFQAKSSLPLREEARLQSKFSYKKATLPYYGQVLFMDRSLGQHIGELEERIRRLSQEIMVATKTLSERNRIETELRVAQEAMEHYQEALRLERKLPKQKE